jgi:hypothetical protein
VFLVALLVAAVVRLPAVLAAVVALPVTVAASAAIMAAVAVAATSVALVRFASYGARAERTQTRTRQMLKGAAWMPF